MTDTTEDQPKPQGRQLLPVSLGDTYYYVSDFDLGEHEEVESAHEVDMERLLAHNYFRQRKSATAMAEATRALFDYVNHGDVSPERFRTLVETARKAREAVKREAADGGGDAS